MKIGGVLYFETGETYVVTLESWEG